MLLADDDDRTQGEIYKAGIVLNNSSSESTRNVTARAINDCRSR